MKWQIRLPWQLMSFRKRQIFNKNGEFDKGWSDVWQKLINDLTNWESMWKAGYQLRLNLEWSLIWWSGNDREISDNGRGIVIKKKQSIFTVVDENISSDWNTSINASRWNYLIKKTVLKLSTNKCGHRNASNSCSHRCIRSNQQSNVFSCFWQ